jgi:hypothetical protein
MLDLAWMLQRSLIDCALVGDDHKKLESIQPE